MRLLRIFTFASLIHVALASSFTLNNFGSPGPYSQPAVASVAVSIAQGGASREAGEVVIQYSSTALATPGERLPLVVFLFPIHGFPFNAWRNLMAPIIRTLTSNGFAVMTPRQIGVGSRVIAGGIFPGQSQTPSGIDLREMATRYINFMTHAVEYVADMSTSDPSFALRSALDTSRIGTMGFSVGGALSQYVAQMIDARMPGRVVCEFAMAPTVGAENLNDLNEIGAQLFAQFSKSMTIPTVFVAGANDGMGGNRDSALYYRDSAAPRVRIIAGSGATHCHAIVPMSECDLTVGTRGIDVLDGVVAHALFTLYLRPNSNQFAEQRRLAESIIWGDGLREMESSRSPSVALAPNRAWTVDAIERAPEIRVTLNQYSISAPLAPAHAELIAVVESSIEDTECEVSVSAEAPQGMSVWVERQNAREFAVKFQWFDYRAAPVRAGRLADIMSRAMQTMQTTLQTTLQTVRMSSRSPEVTSEFGPNEFAPRAAPPRNVVVVTARHECARGGVAKAQLYVNQPY